MVGTKKMTTTKAVVRTTSISQQQLQPTGFGADLAYKLNLNPGTYDVVLWFSEKLGAYYVSDLIRLKAVDIFAQVLLKRQ